MRERRKVRRDVGSLTDYLRADGRIRRPDPRIVAKVAGIRSADPRSLRLVVHDLAEIPHHLRALSDDLRSLLADPRLLIEKFRSLPRDLAERIGDLREDAGNLREDPRELRADPRDLRVLPGDRRTLREDCRQVASILGEVAGSLGLVVRILGSVVSDLRSLAGILARLPRVLVARSGDLRSLGRGQPAIAGGRRAVSRGVVSFTADPPEDDRLHPFLAGTLRSVVACKPHRRPDASHGHTPGATLLTAVMRLWHELSLPPDAVVMHVLAYWAPTTASRGQHDIRFAQAPVEEPPSPPDDAPLEPAPAEQVDEQLLVRHEKTGPSQFAQVLVTHP